MRRVPSRLFVLVVVLVVVLAVDVVTVGKHFSQGRPAHAVDQAGTRPSSLDVPTTATLLLPSTQPSSTPAQSAPTPSQLSPGGPQPALPVPSADAPANPLPLDARLAAAGYEVPRGADVYAVRVTGGRGAPVAYERFEAGGGPQTQDFWPASSIKVLAALGALDFARSLGFSGAATVAFDDGRDRSSIRAIYQAAIADSSNFDYDSLVKIAGVDRLNSSFLTAANGFPVTSIFQSYAGDDLSHSPGMTLQEGKRRLHVPARNAVLAPKCPSENCSNLFELTESVRRVVLNDELPPGERFDLAPADTAALKAALGKADGFFPAAVAATLGFGSRIYDKPGDVADRDCLDVAYIESPKGQRFLLAATVPHSSGGCDALSTLAAGILHVLTA